MSIENIFFIYFLIFFILGAGEIDFDSFCELSSRFLAEEENPEQMQQELREAFRLYDKEGMFK